MIRGSLLCAAVAAALVATPALGQRGTGQTEGVARQGEPPPIMTLSGVVEEVQTGECEMTTGRASIGAHVIIQTDEQGAANLHLGPTAAVEDLIDRLQPDTPIEADVFQTERMPEDAYVAQAITVGDDSFTLRNDTLRPMWAIGPGGGRGQGRGAGQAMGIGQGGRASCWW